MKILNVCSLFCLLFASPKLGFLKVVCGITFFFFFFLCRIMVEEERQCSDICLDTQHALLLFSSLHISSLCKKLLFVFVIHFYSIPNFVNILRHFLIFNIHGTSINGSRKKEMSLNSLHLLKDLLIGNEERLNVISKSLCA